MIGRVVATIGALIPIAAAAAAQSGAAHATPDVPVVWAFLGYPFEAAGMVAALFGCFAARFWIGAGQQLRKEHRWSLDVPVSAMALAVAGALVIMLRPPPFGGLMLGAGVGMLGEGIFKLAERYMAKAVPALGADEPASPPAT